MAVKTIQMKVFSLRAKDGSPRFHQALQTNYWFELRGYEVVQFDHAELLAGKFDDLLKSDLEDVMFFGSVGTMHEVFARAGRPKPKHLEFPEELSEYFGRKITNSTMGEVARWETQEPEKLPVHIKPAKNQKLFTGTVVAQFRDFIPLAAVPDEEPVIVQDVVEMRSEWRATILRRRIINVSSYKGDPVLFPDKEVMLSALEKFSDCPIGFGMDWAVTADGETILIEVNDGFALGNYGVRGYLYTAMFECRWREIMGLPDNGLGLEFE